MMWTTFFSLSTGASNTIVAVLVLVRWRGRGRGRRPCWHWARRWAPEAAIGPRTTEAWSAHPRRRHALPGAPLSAGAWRGRGEGPRGPRVSDLEGELPGPRLLAPQRLEVPSAGGREGMQPAADVDERVRRQQRRGHERGSRQRRPWQKTNKKNNTVRKTIRKRPLSKLS